jgi:glucosyl-dolichyl phosphate glucuronosyltransferase
MELTIIICTYNRENLIKECLQSLTLQTYPKDKFEVLIIDNNSTDRTEVICKEFVKSQPNFRYIKELKQGLGHARNCGYKNAKTEWVAYVDDDAKSHLNYVERAIYIIKNFDFDCFGGVFNAWYTVKKPKWIPEDFGTNKWKQNYTGILNGYSMDGGNMVWKKSVLQMLGGFHTEIGMIGNKISYGEETYVQELARKKGVKIGFDPELQIDHYVQPYKLNLAWQLKSDYAIGIDFWQSFNLTPTKQDAVYLNYQYLARHFFVDLFKNFPKVITKKNYFWQNLLLEVCSPYAIQLGKLKSARKFKKLYYHSKSNPTDVNYQSPLNYK